MSLLDAFGRLLRPAYAAPVMAVLCPRCERPMDQEHDGTECAKTGITRRFLFGLLGASSVALANRLEGIPIPAAHHMVVAHAGDFIRVAGVSGVIAIAWDRPRNDKTVRRYDEYGGIIPASDLQSFMPNEAERIYVDRSIPEMRIVSVVDETTRKPLQFRVVRGAEIHAKREAEAKVQRERQRMQYLQRDARTELDPHNVPPGVDTFFRIPVEGDYVRRRSDSGIAISRGLSVFEPAQGGDPRACYRPLPGWEMVYSFVQDGYFIHRGLPANLRRLNTSRWAKHPTVKAAIERIRLKPRAFAPRLPA